MLPDPNASSVNAVAIYGEQGLEGLDVDKLHIGVALLPKFASVTTTGDSALGSTTLPVGGGPPADMALGAWTVWDGAACAAEYKTPAPSQWNSGNAVTYGATSLSLAVGNMSDCPLGTTITFVSTPSLRDAIAGHSLWLGTTTAKGMLAIGPGEASTGAGPANPFAAWFGGYFVTNVAVQSLRVWRPKAAISARNVDATYINGAVFGQTAEVVNTLGGNGLGDFQQVTIGNVSYVSPTQLMITAAGCPVGDYCTLPIVTDPAFSSLWSSGANPGSGPVGYGWAIKGGNCGGATGGIGVDGGRIVSAFTARGGATMTVTFSSGSSLLSSGCSYIVLSYGQHEGAFQQDTADERRYSCRQHVNPRGKQYRGLVSRLFRRLRRRLGQRYHLGNDINRHQVAVLQCLPTQ